MTSMHPVLLMFAVFATIIAVFVAALVFFAPSPCERRDKARITWVKRCAEHRPVSACWLDSAVLYPKCTESEGR